MAKRSMKICAGCGKKFVPNNPKQRYCSQPCWVTTYNRTDRVHSVTGAAAAAISPKHDLKRGTGKKARYVKMRGQAAHRRAAEEMLGRKLRPGEVVHHKDGDGHNNDWDNLMVLPSQAEHARLHQEQYREERKKGSQ